MDQDCFDGFFHIAHRASMLDILQDPARIRLAVDAISDSDLQSRMRDVVNWLVLEQLFISERNGEFEQAMEAYFHAAVDSRVTASTDDLTKKLREAEDEITHLRQQVKTLTGNLEGQEQTHKNALEAAKNGYEKQLSEKQDTIKKLKNQLSAEQSNTRKLTEKAASLQAKVDKLQEGRETVAITPPQPEPPRNEADPAGLILDFSTMSKDEIIDRLSGLTDAEQSMVESIVFEGKCISPPAIYGFKRVKEITYGKVIFLGENAIRNCPLLERIVFRMGDCTIPEKFMQQDYDGHYQLQEIVAPSGGNIEVFAYNHGIPFRDIGTMDSH